MVYAEKKSATINSFEGGLNSHVNEYLIGGNEAVVAQNVRVNTENGSLSKRSQLITEATISGNSKVTGLYRYYKTDSTQHLIGSESTNLHAKQDSDTGFTVLRDNFTTGKRFQFVTYKNNAIGSNVSQQPVKWDGDYSDTADTQGHRTASNLCADLGAPFADLTTGSNLDASSWYQYKVIHYDGTNYYYSNARSNAIQTGTTFKAVELSDVPLGEVGTTRRQIYRTAGQATRANALATNTFNLVGTIEDNATRLYTDNIADGSLSDAFSTSGNLDVTPPTGKFLELNNQRLFIAGNSTYKSDIYWSDEFNPDYFLATDYDQIRPDDGDEITFLKTFVGGFFIGKTNSIQRYYTDLAETDWYCGDPFTGAVGCHAPYGVAETPFGIIYPNRYGLYLFNGQTSTLISDKVTDVIRDIKKADIEETFGIYWDNQYYFAYTSDESGGAFNNRVLIYDLIRKSYVIDTKDVNCMATLESGSDLGNLYYGSSDTDGLITKDGTAEEGFFIRYKSELDEGVFDDCRSFGTETDPSIKIAWDVTGSADWSAEGYPISSEMTSSGGTQYYWAREDRDCTWTSPINEINASALNKLYWNETLNSYGDLEFRIRLASTAATIPAAAWSDYYSDPSGSDVSGVTANDFMQLQANLSTTDIIYTPELDQSENFVINLAYSELGSSGETSIESIYKTGWLDFEKEVKEQLKRIRIYYQATEGTITFNYKNSEGNVDASFDIDLSVSPDDSDDDSYFGAEGFKMYEYFVPLTEDEDISIGEMWKITLSESGVKPWTIDKIEIIYDPQPIRL